MSLHNKSPGRRLTLAERLRQLHDNLLGLGRRLRDGIAAAISSMVSEVTRDGIRRLLDQLATGVADDDNEMGHRRRPLDDSWHDDGRDAPGRLRHDDGEDRFGHDHNDRSRFGDGDSGEAPFGGEPGDRIDRDRCSDEPDGWRRDPDDAESMDEGCGEDHFWSERDSEPEPTSSAKPKAEMQSRPKGRLDHAIVTGLAAGQWWLRRHQGRRPVVTTLAIAVAAGVAAFLAGPATAAGLGVVSKVGGLLMTADAISCAAAGLAGLVG